MTQFATVGDTVYTVVSGYVGGPDLVLSLTPKLPKVLGAIVEDVGDNYYGMVRTRHFDDWEPSNKVWAKLGGLGELYTEEEANAEVRKWGGFKVVYEGHPDDRDS